MPGASQSQPLKISQTCRQREASLISEEGATEDLQMHCPGSTKERVAPVNCHRKLQGRELAEIRSFQMKIKKKNKALQKRKLE